MAPIRNDLFDPDTPIANPEDSAKRKSKKTQANVLQTSGAAGGARAFSVQLLQFYFRAPVKAFFRMRVDYLAVARAINPRVQAKEPWSWGVTTPGLLTHAVREHGWGFIPHQVLPPLFANATVGAILYTSYLQVLSKTHPPSSENKKRIYPPPCFSHTFTAGFTAGAIQSLVAAPLDALVIRFKANEFLEGGYKSVYAYSRAKLAEIGPRGVFSGYSLSFMKEALGYGLFFSSFEYIKQQSYFRFLVWFYGKRLENRVPSTPEQPHTYIRPHYALEPAFLLLAGASAAFSQQLVYLPLQKIQNAHHSRLESMDIANRTQKMSALTAYRKAYAKTMVQCRKMAAKRGGWVKWLYRGYVGNTLRQVPSTSAGLLVFELVRRRYGDDTEQMVIEYGDSTILLS